MIQRGLVVIPLQTIAIIVGSAMVIAGCATKAAAPESAPKIDIPTAWNGSSLTNNHDNSTWPKVDWWKKLGCVELTQLVEQGIQNNVDIAVAIEHVHEAESAVHIANTALFPSMTFGASEGKTSGIVGGNGTTSASGLLNISYEVDFWGANKVGVNAANAQLQANQYDRETVALTITSSIVSTYLQVLSLRDQIAIANQNSANVEKLKKVVEAQARAGSATRLDLVRQIAAVAAQKARIPVLMQQEREALSALAILLGRSPQSFNVNEQGLGTILLPEVMPGLPSELLTRRPDIRHSEANLEAAKANVEQARAALFPSITLSGYAGAQSNALLSLFNIPNLVKNIAADIVVPVFDSGRLYSQRDIVVAQKQELLQLYRATVINAFAEVDNALGMIQSLQEQAQFKQIEMEQMSVAFALSERRYRDGAEDLKTVLDTQSSLSNVRLQQGQIKLAQLKAIVSLYKALGGGWQDEAAHGHS